MPDISLLVPLAEQLNVTVAELLQGRWVEEERRFTREETEEPHPQGADLFGRAAGAPSGADEEVSAGVCHLLCAGRRRSAGRLGGGTGRHRGSAGSAHRRCGFRRRLRGLCHVLDGRDPAPLLRREPHLQLCTGCVPHPHPGHLLQQPQLEAYRAGVPGLVDGVAGAGAALHGGGRPA